jgi:hypothetical protein
MERYPTIPYMSDVIDKLKQDGDKGGLFVAWTKKCCIKQQAQPAARVDGRWPYFLVTKIGNKFYIFFVSCYASTAATTQPLVMRSKTIELQTCESQIR